MFLDGWSRKPEAVPEEVKRAPLVASVNVKEEAVKQEPAPKLEPVAASQPPLAGVGVSSGRLRST